MKLLNYTYEINVHWHALQTGGSG